MFIKRNRTVLAGKDYQSVLLVQGKRVAAKRPPGRPAAGAPAPKSVVVHETLANLSKLPPISSISSSGTANTSLRLPRAPIYRPMAPMLRPPFTWAPVTACWPPWMAWPVR